MTVLGPLEGLQLCLQDWVKHYLESEHGPRNRISDLKDLCNTMVGHVQEALENLLYDSMDYGFALSPEFLDRVEELLPRIFFCSRKPLESVSCEDIRRLDLIGDRFDQMAQDLADLKGSPDPKEVCDGLLFMLELAARAVALTEFAFREARVRNDYLDYVSEGSYEAGA